jgi:hypothetical protein
MNNELKISLINGFFDHEDATEIILSMLDKKIEYHELNSFRNLVKLNLKDLNLEKRIDELKKTKSLFIEFINSNKDKNFKIDSEIMIKIV